MISLKEQIISFVFSFVYGLIVYFLYKKIYKYLYYSKKIYCILNSFLFIIDLVLVYFKMFYIICDGYISIYFILITFIVFLCLNKKYN